MGFFQDYISSLLKSNRDAQEYLTRTRPQPPSPAYDDSDRSTPTSYPPWNVPEGVDIIGAKKTKDFIDEVRYFTKPDMVQMTPGSDPIDIRPIRALADVGRVVGEVGKWIPGPSQANFFGEADSLVRQEMKDRGIGWGDAAKGVAVKNPWLPLIAIGSITPGSKAWKEMLGKLSKISNLSKFGSPSLTKEGFSMVNKLVSPENRGKVLPDLKKFIEGGYDDLGEGIGSLARQEISPPLPTTQPTPTNPSTPKSAQKIKIISGGQTGGDIGALLAAKELSLETGGTMPKGWITSAGKRPNYKTEFNMVEDPSSNYVPRTIKNINDADATIAILWGPSVGTSKTIGYAQTGNWINGKPTTTLKGHRPVLVITTKNVDEASAQIQKFIKDTGAKTINVAGHRESTQPGIETFTKNSIKKALSNQTALPVTTKAPTLTTSLTQLAEANLAPKSPTPQLSITRDKDVPPLKGQQSFIKDFPPKVNSSRPFATIDKDSTVDLTWYKANAPDKQGNTVRGLGTEIDSINQPKVQIVNEGGKEIFVGEVETMLKGLESRFGKDFRSAHIRAFSDDAIKSLGFKNRWELNEVLDYREGKETAARLTPIIESGGKVGKNYLNHLDRWRNKYFKPQLSSTPQAMRDLKKYEETILKAIKDGKNVKLQYGSSTQIFPQDKAYFKKTLEKRAQDLLEINDYKEIGNGLYAPASARNQETLRTQELEEMANEWFKEKGLAKTPEIDPNTLQQIDEFGDSALGLKEDISIPELNRTKKGKQISLDQEIFRTKAINEGRSDVEDTLIALRNPNLSIPDSVNSSTRARYGITDPNNYDYTTAQEAAEAAYSQGKELYDMVQDFGEDALSVTDKESLATYANEVLNMQQTLQESGQHAWPAINIDGTAPFDKPPVPAISKQSFDIDEDYLDWLKKFKVDRSGTAIDMGPATKKVTLTPEIEFQKRPPATINKQPKTYKPPASTQTRKILKKGGSLDDAIKALTIKLEQTKLSTRKQTIQEEIDLLKSLISKK